MKTKSAPVAIPARRASQPQCRPMTSMTKAREWDEAVEEMESIDSQIRCKAVKAPMVRSVIDMSLLKVSYVTHCTTEEGDILLDGSDETNNVEVLVGVFLLVIDSAYMLANAAISRDVTHQSGEAL